MAKTSPTNVFEAYRKQFEKDFTKLLVLRSHEMTNGGHMILMFAGRSKPDPTSEDCCVIWELLAKSLVDMVKEVYTILGILMFLLLSIITTCDLPYIFYYIQGLVEESKVSSFNVPQYTPYEGEVRDVIQKEGSFSLHSVNGFALSWPTPGINTAKFIRAISEPLIATHFGSSIMDVLFKKYQEHVVDHLATKKGMNYNLIISLIKK
ncbi:putative methyltransferase [Helianthus annuus]|nr:putative methyltransferase [Helianthus annuus]KAJ0675051.1 putative methyltransferase [Helianthus annuus]